MSEHPAPVAADRERAAEALALLLAKNRTHGDVFMDGSHNPRPSEVVKARRFVDEWAAALTSPAPAPSDEWVWTCGRCGQAPEAHADGGTAAACIYASVLTAPPTPEVERLREALRSIRAYSYTADDETHRSMGEACGEDLCLGCLIHGTADAALAAQPSEGER